MQLSQRVRARDVEEFFSSVGKIRDVKLIVCNKTKRFKGICYVEFRDLEAVSLVRMSTHITDMPFVLVHTAACMLTIPSVQQH